MTITQELISMYMFTHKIEFKEEENFLECLGYVEYLINNQKIPIELAWPIAFKKVCEDVHILHADGSKEAVYKLN